jgi:hypothetical protein
MTFEELGEWIKEIGVGRKMSSAQRKRVAAELPGFIVGLSAESAPKRLKLPTGESLQNATRMTALKCHCLLLARYAVGMNYTKANSEYERLAKDTLFWVMRNHFMTGEPEGIFCCPACTLSLLPLYALDAFRWVKCRELESNVLSTLRRNESVFASAYPQAYAKWAVSFAREKHASLR